MPSHVTADWTRSLIRAVIRTAHLTYSASTTRSSATCSSWTSWKLLARLMQFSMISGVTIRYVILYRNIDGEMDRELDRLESNWSLKEIFETPFHPGSGWFIGHRQRKT